MQSFTIIMLGPRKVGKTTFLAATWEKFKKGLFDQTDLRLKADPDTAGQLEERLEELRTIPEMVKSKGGLQTEPLVLGTEAFGIERTLFNTTYSFQLAAGQAEPVIQLTFKDYPGESILKATSFITEELRGAHAAIVAIDSPALMESERENWEWLNDQHNKPSVIATALEAYRKTDSPRLVLFVPIRCETYLRFPDEAKKLVDRVKSGYREAFEVLASNPKIAVVITPIQTIGTIYFDDLIAESNPEEEPTNSDYAFAFRKLRRGDSYKPQDTEQPLSYLTRFFLSQYITQRKEERYKGFDDKGFFSKLWVYLKDTFSDLDFKFAVQTFSQQSKEESPFVIVQGKHLLNQTVES